MFRCRLTRQSPEINGNLKTDVSMVPYLPNSLRLGEEIARKEERRSSAFLRRMMTPRSISFVNLRHTVVRELTLMRSSCFSVSGRPCSSAYPISIIISKSTMDFKNGSCALSKTLIFLNDENNFIVFVSQWQAIVPLKYDVSKQKLGPF